MCVGVVMGCCCCGGGVCEMHVCNCGVCVNDCGLVVVVVCCVMV